MYTISPIVQHPMARLWPEFVNKVQSRFLSQQKICFSMGERILSLLLKKRIAFFGIETFRNLVLLT